MDGRTTFVLFVGLGLAIVVLLLVCGLTKEWIRRKKELNFIKKWREGNESSIGCVSEAQWELHHGYKMNYRTMNWCRFCRYWVEMEDGSSYKYRKGICKLRYKQSYNKDDAATYHNWGCKYYK